MPDPLLYSALYLITGAIAGLMAGLLGIGGGLVIVPALIWLFTAGGIDTSVTVHLAVGTSLATIIVTSISSIRTHHLHRAVNWELVRQLALGLMLGAMLGALVADLLSTIWLQRTFACFVMLISIQMVVKGKVPIQRELPGKLGLMLVGGLIGKLSAIVGIGGGSLTTPFLTACGISIRYAVATSAACGFPIATMGALGFIVTGWAQQQLPPLSTGYIYWPAFLGIVSTSIVTAPLGAKLAHSVPVVILSRVFAAFLFLAGVKLLFT